MRCLFTVATFFSFFIAKAQYTHSLNGADILLHLKKLQTAGSVLYIAAHPDDENNTLLPYLAKEKKYRTAYLSLTRGDGGQNLIGPEQGIELGLIRTQELLAARQIDGSEQYFTTAYEFGYSKSAIETFSIWEKEKILADVVWVIRKFTPDVIITRFPADARGGHGHHTASAILAEEAFEAAANPLKFKEQLQNGVDVWQAKRLLWNTFNFGSINTTSDNQFKLQVNNLNPLLGKSYGEIGAEARTMHKSQGEGRPRIRGNRTEFFTTLQGNTPKVELLDEVDISWNKILSNSEAAIADKIIAEAIKNYNVENPSTILPLLVELYSLVNRALAKSTSWQQYKLDEIKKLIEACSGLVIEATTSSATGVEKDTAKINLLVTKRYPVNATLIQTNVGGLVQNIKTVLENNVNFTNAIQIPLTNKDNYTNAQPYWLNEPIKNGQFIVNQQQNIGNALNKPCVEATFYIQFDSTEIAFTKAVLYKYTDLVKGELYQPFVVIPAISLYMSPSVKLNNVISNGKKIAADDSIRIIATSNINIKNVPITLLALQEKQKEVFANQLYNLEKDKQYNFTIPISKFYNNKAMPFMEAALQINIQNNTLTFNKYIQKIQYDHIPSTYYFFKDYVQFINEPIQVKGKKIGYIMGAGDFVLDAIKQLGYDADILLEKDITTQNLQQYDVIVTGVRAYNMHEYLTNKYDVLMNYITNGGHIVVQYLRNNFVGTKPIKVGPYNFSPTAQSRITNENAPITFAIADHPFINTPNLLSSKDFEGWVQERSTYQAEQYHAAYKAPFSMNDDGEKPTNGSIITTAFGKGNFTYVSMALFRQLPAGNAGAYKLFANILSLGK